MPYLVRDALGLVEGIVEEIVRALAVAAIDDVGRMQPRRQNLAFGQEAALHHIGQHLVGAGARRRQVDVRGVFRGRLEQAGEHGAFGERQILDVLAEIEIRRGRDAERAAAHIGAVEIELQDFLLRQVHFQPNRQEGFLDLALDRALVGQEQVLGELLRDGRTALHHGIGLDVLGHGAEQAQEIDAEMVEEAAILGGQHRIDDMVRHLVDRHGVALDDAALADLVAVAVEEGDGEIALVAPVLAGFVEGRQSQRQHDHRAGGAHRGAFAEQLDDRPPPAADAEATEEDGQVFPDFAGLEATFVQGRIDPRVDFHKARSLGAFPRLALFERVFHSALPSLSWQRQ